MTGRWMPAGGRQLRVETNVGDVGALFLLVRDHEAAGGFWFSPSTMAFFQSRVETGLLDDGRFVSSEQRPAGPYDDEDPPRLFTVRRFADDDAFLVSTVGDFQEHDTLEAAIAAARNI